jgi:hypothetical protein
VTEQNKIVSSRGFLQTFEQGIGRGGIHGVGVVDQDDSVMGLQGRKGQGVFDFPDRFHLDASLFRFNQQKIRVVFQRGRRQNLFRHLP